MTTPKVVDSKSLVAQTVGEYEQAQLMEKGANLFSIDSIEDMNAATVYLGKIAELKKAVEKRRREIVGPMQEFADPLNASIESANKFFRTNLGTPLKNAETRIKGLMIDYREREKKAAIEEQRQVLKEAQERAKTESKPLIPEPIVPIISQPAKTFRSSSGAKAQFREVWDFEVTDISVLPREFMLINHTAIKAKVDKLKGETRIPGVRVFPKTQVASR